MKHDSQFSQPPKETAQQTRDIASLYARVFQGSDEGKRVLADLTQRYSPYHPSFDPRAVEPLNPIGAAIRDGEKAVILFIIGAVNLGAPSAVNPNPKP